jgi:hypothetical protein
MVLHSITYHTIRWSGTWPKHVGFNVILLLKFLIVIVHLVGSWFLKCTIFSLYMFLFDVTEVICWFCLLGTDKFYIIFTVHFFTIHDQNFNQRNALYFHFICFSLMLRKLYVDFACWALINFILFSPCIFLQFMIKIQSLKCTIFSHKVKI